MNYLHNGLCYPELTSALSAYYGGSPTDLFQLSNSQLMQLSINYNGTSFEHIASIFNLDGSFYGSVTVPTVAVSFPDCTLPNDPYTSFIDGHTLGWGVAVVMITAFAIRSIYRK